MRILHSMGDVENPNVEKVLRDKQIASQNLAKFYDNRPFFHGYNRYAPSTIYDLPRLKKPPPFKLG